MKNETPMGISNWIEHGVKYGYERYHITNLTGNLELYKRMYKEEKEKNTKLVPLTITSIILNGCLLVVYFLIIFI